MRQRKMDDVTDNAAGVPGASGQDLQLFLAVDLDGTFLGGSEAQRAKLYDLIKASRSKMKLAFVTGRDIAFASRLGDDGFVPVPDLIIGDVGTSVAVGPDWKPEPTIEAWIEDQWPGPDAAAQIMTRHPKLKLQDVFAGRRLSYFYTDQGDVDAAAQDIEAAGYDALSSADLFFDVLPRGVGKGATLLRVLSHLGVSHDRVLTAGDTMNDLSLFQTGLNSVAVGNAEPRLRQAINGLSNVYLAGAEGCGGIFEALEHYSLMPKTS